MEYELSIDTKSICRVCLAEHPSLKTIFCNEIVNGSILPFPKVFECVIGLKACKDDGFPAQLCPPCRQTTTESYILQQKCKSNRLLVSGILNIPLNDESEVKPKKVYVSTTTQTIEIREPGQCRTTQTDVAAAVPTMTQGVQTHAYSTESAHTQTETSKNVSKRTQTEQKQPNHTESSSQTTTTDTQTLSVAQVVTIKHTSDENTILKLQSTNPVKSIDFHQPVAIVKPKSYAATNTDTVSLPDKDAQIPVTLHTDDETDSQTIEFLYGEPPIIATVGDDEHNVHNDDEPYAEYLIEEYTEPESSLLPVVKGEDEDEDDEQTVIGDEIFILDSSDEQSIPSITSHTSAASQLPIRKRPAASAATNPTTPKLRKRVVANEVQLTCTLCSYLAKSDSDLGTHVLAHRHTLPTLLNSFFYFRCADCNSVFLRPEDVDAHHSEALCQRSRANGGDADSGCTDYQVLDDEWLTGDMGFDGELDLDSPDLVDVHQRMCSVARAADGQCECDRCENFTTAMTSDVWVHYQETHYGPAAAADDERWTDDEVADDEVSRAKFADTFGKVHKCGYCDKVFRTVRMAMAHVYFHADQFVCPYDGCMDTYQRYALLGHHLVRKHLPEGASTFVCGHCSAEFAVYTNYRTHLRSECVYRQYKCDLCEKRFFTKPHLDAHVEYHLNVRRFKCQYCEKRFTQSGDVRIHERIHTGDKPYKCPFCPKQFRSIGNRKDHVATHDATTKVTVSVFGKSQRRLGGFC